MDNLRIQRTDVYAMNGKRIGTAYTDGRSAWPIIVELVQGVVEADEGKFSSAEIFWDDENEFVEAIACNGVLVATLNRALTADEAEAVNIAFHASHGLATANRANLTNTWVRSGANVAGELRRVDGGRREPEAA